ncbi:PREDICTED: zinc metalloproteinase nas-4-like [Priapulus caudatus]|uniref:Metalloendopeptidase n=1 Tax=Priapulus caudatus TaxID=37621 RepID=A0ABM1ERX0_PRICU|nr:PREDICTED: zinc metalloproteinase nas-4-like [Priapulus caudatus]
MGTLTVLNCLGYTGAFSLYSRARRLFQHELLAEIGRVLRCFSNVGRTGGAQELGLTSYCINRYGSIIHEFLHALGFHHQHSTHDRDNWVEIIWDNIEPGFEHNFKKYDVATVTQFSEMYDYYSIMHYSAYAFTSNGKPTIKPLQEIGYEIGQRDGFSYTDIAKLNAMYGCRIPA